mmetsp:Transcript_6738/g.10785  ORF Transcript_6738/g.10785 Transcript_6738/m.10785 type:complete len:103 (+) Transcript_6738:142-450(+)
MLIWFIIPQLRLAGVNYASVRGLTSGFGCEDHPTKQLVACESRIELYMIVESLHARLREHAYVCMKNQAPDKERDIFFFFCSKHVGCCEVVFGLALRRELHV